MSQLSSQRDHLLVNELVKNAVVHAGAGPTVEIRRGEGVAAHGGGKCIWFELFVVG